MSMLAGPLVART